MYDSRKNDKKSKGDEDMAIAQHDVKARLSELKKRANARKNGNAKPSAEYLNQLDKNAELLYADQLNTMKNE